MIERIDIVSVIGLDMQIGLLLAMLEDVTTEWRGELAGWDSDSREIPQEAVVWQPFPGAHSIGGLILHMADVEADWLHEVGAGQVRSEEERSALLSRETQQYQVQWPVPPAQPLSWYYAQQDAVRARTRELVAALNDPDHLGIKQNGENQAEITLRWLLYHVLTHEAYHGGQAVLLSIMHDKLPKASE